MVPAPEWELFDDPVAFLDVAGAFLERDPLTSNVLTVIAERERASVARGEPAPERPRWFALARSGGEIVGAAMRTSPFPPHPVYLLPMPDAAAVALADLLLARGEDPGGANGALPAATMFVERVAAESGRTPSVRMRTRLHEVREVVPPQAPAAGGPRVATADDATLLTAWFRAFLDEADAQAGRPPEVRDAAADAEAAEHVAESVQRRVAAGMFWVWEVDGEVVHFSGHAEPVLGVARIGPVFTPREHRGRGYASALVAYLSQRLLDAGYRVCPFTDQANPVSNGVYARLGYAPVVDMAELRLQ
jgi:predicted GNAT family acetyltransferase